MKRKLTLWVGLAISVLFLYLALRNVEFVEIRRSLSQVDLLLLIWAAVIFMVSFSIRALRWRYILRPIKEIDLPQVFSVLSIGFMANNVLPARLGEVVRAYFLSKKTGIRKSLSLATIVLERLSDFAALLLSALLVSLFFSLPPAVERVGIVAGLIFVFFVLLLIFFHFRKDETLRFFERVLFILSPTKKQRMMERVNAFVEGLLILKSGKGFLWIFSLSVAVWALWVVALHYTLLAFDIQVPFSARLLILAVVNLGALIPSSPGYVGPYQYLCWVCLSIFAIDKSLAFSFSIVLHALWYVPLTSLGFIFLWREHVSIGQIRSLEARVASQGFSSLEIDEPDELRFEKARGDDGYEPDQS
ncbi:flippase-like domain-containing protein [bacterium]|nr:flippase-like domain-containing protein [bacterium]